MSDAEGKAARRTVIGGRHGSPTVTVALPFARITNVDDELRDTLADLTALVARLASNIDGGDATELALIVTAAEELSARFSATR